MQLPHPRITVHRLMVAVAVVALVIGSVQLSSRRAQFLLLAAHNGAQERKFLRDLVAPSRASLTQAEKAEEDRYDRVRAIYSGELKRKYERATRYPWLSVEPDPPYPR